MGTRVGKKWQEEPSASCNVRDLWLCLIIRSDLVQSHMRVDQGFFRHAVLVCALHRLPSY